MNKKIKTGIILLLIPLFLMPFIPSVYAQRYGAKIDHIRYVVIKTPDAQTLAMTRDEIDFLTDLIRPTDIETLNREGKRILSTPGDHFCYCCMNMRPGRSWYFGPQDGGMPGLALRHAIAHLIPKSVLIGTLFKYIVTLIHVPMSAALGDFGEC
jgi:ABC-type transport system substrate-binding protein